MKPFDSDTRALKERELLNAAGAQHDLENWIFENVGPLSGASVLDLGCGRGKQVFALVPLVFPNGSVLGVDISADAVNEVNTRALEGHAVRVRAIKAGLDECIEVLGGVKFNLILSTYSIYYSKNMTQLLSELRTMLETGGQLFVCGPGEGTNKELIEVINQVQAGSLQKAEPIADFISEAEINEVARHYSTCWIERLNNNIRFRSAESILRWWRNHNSFIPESYEGVARALEAHFATSEEFMLTKNVLGVQYRA